jgi:hypothetical protein
MAAIPKPPPSRPAGSAAFEETDEWGFMRTAPAMLY